MSTEESYFHIFNRGVDKRSIFEDEHDVYRFLTSMREFNTDTPVGGIYVASLNKNKLLKTSKTPIVTFVAYCLNKNHFHFVLKPLITKGGSLYIQRLSAGYTKYFNEKYDRSGALFQGKYKRVVIETNEQLLHVSAYVSANDRAHPGLNPVWFAKIPFSSLKEYTAEAVKNPLCNKEIILEQYPSSKQYLDFVESSLIDILERKKRFKELNSLHLE